VWIVTLQACTILEGFMLNVAVHQVLEIVAVHTKIAVFGRRGEWIVFGRRCVTISTVGRGHGVVDTGSEKLLLL
jgi:hypothetical protein